MQNRATTLALALRYSRFTQMMYLALNERKKRCSARYLFRMMVQSHRDYLLL
jgi:hypothetical protein